MQSKASLNPTLAAAPSRAAPRSTLQWRDFVVYIFFAAVLAFFAFTIGDKGFLSTANLFNITRTTSMIAVIAVAMTFVIAAGELDLSVGSTAALAALTSALAMQAGFGLVGGVAAALLSGLLVGAINGFFVTVVNIPSFLVTLGMMQFVRGLDMRVTYTKPVPIADTTFTSLFGSGSIGPVPSLFVWSVAVAALGHVVLRYTPFGRQISGVAGALSGMLYSGMMQTARYSFGTGAELAAIAAVILGGTSLFGGKATIIGTFVGALLIGTINNGLIIMGLDVSEQNMVAGALIVLAVAFGRKRIGG